MIENWLQLTGEQQHACETFGPVDDKPSTDSDIVRELCLLHSTNRDDAVIELVDHVARTRGFM